MAWEFDQNRMQDRREESKQGGGSDFFKWEEGDTVVYVCEPCRPDDPFNFVEVKQHRVGGQEMNVICLNAEKNKVLEHPALVEALELRNDGGGIDLGDGCPVCQDLAAGLLKGAAMKSAKLSGRFFWNIIPIKFRPDGRSPWKTAAPADQVRPALVSWTLWDGIMNQYGNEGNVSDPDKAIYIVVTREGTGKMDTEYGVSLDTTSVRNPVSLSDEARATIAEALQPGGTGDLYKIIASMVKTPEQIRELMDGAGGKDDKKVATAPKKAAATTPIKGAAATPKGGSKKPAGAPPCYANDCTPADKECQECPHKEGCAAACGVEVPPDITSVKPFVKPEKAPAKGPKRVNASEAEEGETYKLPSGVEMQFTGTAKGKFFFENEDGERLGLKGDELIEPVVKAQEKPAAKKPEPAAKKEETAELTAADATDDAWYTLPGDETPRQFKGSSVIKGVKKGFFEDEDGNRALATMDVVVTPVEGPAAKEEEPAMPAQEEGGEDTDAIAELDRQLAQRKAKQAKK